MVGSGANLVVLVLGAVVVLVDGQLIFRTSPSYLSQAYRDPRRARQTATLATLLFHLVMLGVLALIASLGIGPDPNVPVVLARLGVIFLLTAIGHGITIAVLSRMREQQAEIDRAQGQLADRPRTVGDAVRERRRAAPPAPVPDQRAADTSAPVPTAPPVGHFREIGGTDRRR